MRSFKFITLFLAVSLISFFNQLTMAQIGAPMGTDELATIACNEDVVGLKLTGTSPPSDPVLRNLATQPEARLAAANVLADRVRAFMASAETRRLRASLEAIAAGGRTPECRRIVESSIEFSYFDDPLLGLYGAYAGWRPGSKGLKKGDTHKQGLEEGRYTYRLSAQRSRWGWICVCLVRGCSRGWGPRL